jgi:hypothetical protein
MATNGVELEKVAVEIQDVHDDVSKELDAGLRPLDHYKQVQFLGKSPKLTEIATGIQISLTTVCTTFGTMGNPIPCRATGDYPLKTVQLSVRTDMAGYSHYYGHRSSMSSL